MRRRRPGPAAAGAAQPGRQRRQVHRARRGRRSGSRLEPRQRRRACCAPLRRQGHRHRHLRRRPAARSSSRSPRPTARPRGVTAAPAWAWPSAAQLVELMGGEIGWRASRAGAARSGSPSRLQPAPPPRRRTADAADAGCACCASTTPLAARASSRAARRAGRRGRPRGERRRAVERLQRPPRPTAVRLRAARRQMPEPGGLELADACVKRAARRDACRSSPHDVAPARPRPRELRGEGIDGLARQAGAAAHLRDVAASVIAPSAAAAPAAAVRRRRAPEAASRGAGSACSSSRTTRSTSRSPCAARQAGPPRRRRGQRPRGRRRRAADAVRRRADGLPHARARRLRGDDRIRRREQGRPTGADRRDDRERHAGDRERCFAVGDGRLRDQAARRAPCGAALALGPRIAGPCRRSRARVDPVDAALSPTISAPCQAARTRPDLLGELIDLFLGDLPAALRRDPRRPRGGRPAGVRAAAHSLKGSAGNLGARPLAAPCQDVECRIARRGSLEGVAALVAPIGRRGGAGHGVPPGGAPLGRSRAGSARAAIFARMRDLPIAPRAFPALLSASVRRAARTASR